MHKCQNCGQEFDGNFCPECGNRFEECLICPKCSTALPNSAKFCTGCGFSFIKTSTHQPSSNSGITQQTSLTKKKNDSPSHLLKRAYFVLPKIPPILFALFSVLLFFFYLAPAVIRPSFEFFGEKFPSESYGNIYQLVRGLTISFGDFGDETVAIPELQGITIALISLAEIMLIFAIAWLIRNHYVKYHSTILTFIAAVFELTILVISAVFIGKIATFDGGLGLLAAGAGLILLLIFSVLYFSLTTGSALFRIVIEKKYPTIQLDSISNKQGFATKPNPPINHVRAKPILPKQNSIAVELIRLKNRKSLPPLLLFGPIIVVFLVIGLSMLLYYLFDISFSLSGDTLPIIIVCCIPILIIIHTFVNRKRTRIASIQTAKRNIGITVFSAATIAIIFVVSILIIPRILEFRTTSKIDLYELFVDAMDFSIPAAYLLFLFVLSVKIKGKSKKLLYEIYGTKKRSSQIEYNGERGAEWAQYEEAIKEYFISLATYKREVKVAQKELRKFRYSHVRYLAGIPDDKKVSKMVLWLLVHRITAWILLIVLTTGIVLATALPLVPKKQTEEETLCVNSVMLSEVSVANEVESISPHYEYCEISPLRYASTLHLRLVGFAIEMT